MENNFNKIFFRVLRSEIENEPLPCEVISSISYNTLDAIYNLAKRHDLTHLFAEVLWENKVFDTFPDANPKFQEKWGMAWYRSERTYYAYEQICVVLEESKIDFVPLKGMVIRGYYPRPEMRIGCDIDILIRERDIDRATDILIERLNCKNNGKGTHDIQLFTDDNVHIELHYSLIEENFSKECFSVLRDVWSYIKVSETYKKELTDDMLYFYHIAHMAKHFSRGGCGIRPFLDIYYLKKANVNIRSQATELLKEANLEIFADKCEQLVNVWINGAEYDALMQIMENYVLFGGVYGNLQNKEISEIVKLGGKLRYYMSKVWKPYDDLAFQYPSLKKRKWLLPYYQVCRWGRLIFKGGAQKTIKEIGLDGDISMQRKNISIMLRELEL